MPPDPNFELTDTQKAMSGAMARVFNEHFRDLDGRIMVRVRDDLGHLLEPMRKQIAEIRTSAVATSKTVFETRAAIRIASRHDLTPAQKFIRHSVVKIATNHQRPAEEIWRRFYTKAVADIATTTAPNWLGNLVAADALDFLATGTAPSVFATLAERGRTVDLAGRAVISVPYRRHGQVGGGWVGEGQPIPLAQALLDSLMIERRKVGVLSGFSNELARGPKANIESFVETILRADLVSLLDAAMLSATAATAAAPAGLLSGVAALPSTGDMLTDLKLLTKAVLDAGGTSVAFIVSPIEALDIGTLAAPPPFVSSASVPAGTVVALDPSAFVGLLDQPSVDVSEEAIVHSQTTPAPIVGKDTAPPALGDISTPVRSFFQTNSTSVRVFAFANWQIADKRIAWMQDVSWNAVTP